VSPERKLLRQTYRADVRCPGQIGQRFLATPFRLWRLQRGRRGAGACRCSCMVSAQVARATASATLGRAGAALPASPCDGSRLGCSRPQMRSAA
jgi:hypothetical protein